MVFYRQLVYPTALASALTPFTEACPWKSRAQKTPPSFYAFFILNERNLHFTFAFSISKFTS
jgi:hypothetical protein